MAGQQVVAAGRGNNTRSVLRKIIITVVVGAVSFPLTDLLFSSVPAQLAMAAGFGAVVLLIQFLIDFEIRLARVESGQRESAAEIRATVARGYSNVNSATELFARVESSDLSEDRITRLVRNAALIRDGMPALAAALAEAEIDRTANLLRALAEQEASYDGEDQDWLLGLTRSVRFGIDAISTPAVDAAGCSVEGFWESNLGRRFLTLQRDTVARGVAVRRVFVIEREATAADPGLRRLCQLQAGLGIEVRLLCPSALPPHIRASLFDFALFDNVISYELTPAIWAAEGQSPTILHTRLVLREDRVAERVERYQRIWAAAIPWDSPQFS